MTVSSTTAKNTYSGDGSDTTFDFTFPILDETHLEVSVKDTNGTITVQTLTTNYTVSGTGNDTGKTDYTSGTVTFVSAPAATDTVIIKRSVPLKQETDYSENDAFPAETHEEALDELTMIAQELNEKLDRTLKYDAAVSGFDATIPTPAASKFIKINSSANGFELSDSLAGITDVVSDTTPQLGGDLDLNGSDIVSVSGADIDLHSDNDVNVILGDAAGVDDFNIKDSANSKVFEVNSNGDVTVAGTVDGRDLATDGTKLDGIEALADVTDAANVTTAISGITGAVDFGGASSFEIPSGTSVTTDAAGEIAMDTDGNGSTVTHGTIQGYDGTQNLYWFGATNYPSSDNDVMVYNSATNSVLWEAQSGASGSISNIVEDATPQLGGQLDVNGNAIGDGTRELITFTEDASAVNQVNIENEATGSGPIISAAGDDTNIDLNIDTKGTGTLNLGSADAPVVLETDTIDAKTGGTSRLDINDSGVRLGAANARVTTILDEDTMSSDSATALATQQSIKAYVDSVGGGKVLQVVSGTLTTTATSSSATFTDTGLSASITPASTSNNILVLVQLCVGVEGTATTVDAKLLRDSTDINIGTTAGSRTNITVGANTDNDATTTIGMAYVDSPSTTSATTYKVQYRNGFGTSTAAINRSANDTNASSHARGASSIVLLEIDGS